MTIAGMIHLEKGSTASDTIIGIDAIHLATNTLILARLPMKLVAFVRIDETI